MPDRGRPPAPARAVLVPVKAFADAKLRLAKHLPPEERRRLARSMAGSVVAAASPMPVAVACDDAEVAEWAVAAGAAVVWTPGTGLNGAVERGVAHLADGGFDVVIVAHADLPLVRSIGPLGTPGVAALAPDRRGDGTNVAAVPSLSGFRFSYGPGSFGRHRAEAERLGLAVEVIERADLAWDVDVPDDLEALSAAGTRVLASRSSPDGSSPASGDPRPRWRTTPTAARGDPDPTGPGDALDGA